jgi:RNA polymerase sigma factor (TIGR02999 family)
LKLQSETNWENSGHFFAAAAEAMRRILVDAARRRKALKRGGGNGVVDLELDGIASPVPDDELLDVDAALERLAAKDPVKADLVKLRFFAGFTADQAAEALGLSPSTADRHWTFARAWLSREIAASRQS